MSQEPGACAELPNGELQPDFALEASIVEEVRGKRPIDGGRRQGARQSAVVLKSCAGAQVASGIPLVPGEASARRTTLVSSQSCPELCVNIDTQNRLINGKFDKNIKLVGNK